MPSQPTVVEMVADGTPGGGTTAVLGLCADVTRTGRWMVTLISSHDSYALKSADRLGIEAKGMEFFDSSLSWKRITDVFRFLRSRRPSIVHVHGARAALPIAIVSLLGREWRIVYTIHGFHFVKKGILGRVSGAMVEWLVARLADAVVYVSRGDQQIARRWHLEGSPGTRAMVIYNGIEPAEIKEIRPRKAYDVVFVGRMVRQKNPLFVIDIMKLLAARGISLLMIGGGPLLDAVRERATAEGIADSIRFAGELAHPQAIEAMQSARIYLFPSLWEGLPIAPLEASFLGLPVVASNISGTDEVVIDGHNGILVNGFRAEEFAAAIRRLLDKPGACEEMGDNGRQLVLRKFLRSRCSREYVELYDALLGEAR